jgi:hypothetical protein
LLEGVVVEQLEAAADQSTGSRVGEELLVQVTGGDDSDGGGAREVIKELLDLLDLELCAVLDPGLLEQICVFLLGSSRSEKRELIYAGLVIFAHTKYRIPIG